MNFGQLKESIRFKVDDIKRTRFTDEQIVQALNEAHQHVYRELIKQNTFTDVGSFDIEFTSAAQETIFPFDSDSPSATFGAGVQKILYVQDSSGNPIPVYSEVLSKRSDIRSVYVRRRILWIGSGNQTRMYLGFHVCPTSTFTFTVFFVPTAFDFAVGSEDTHQNNRIPREHHDVVVLRATILLLASDEDKAQTWFAIYADALQSMKDSVELNNDEADTVVDLQTETYYASDRS